MYAFNRTFTDQSGDKMSRLVKKYGGCQGYKTRQRHRVANKESKQEAKGRYFNFGHKINSDTVYVGVEIIIVMSAELKSRCDSFGILSDNKLLVGGNKVNGNLGIIG